MRIHEHQPVIRRRNLGRSIPFNRPLYGSGVSCTCKQFQEQVNEPGRAAAMEVWWEHARSLTRGLNWVRFGSRTNRSCEATTADGARCTRKALWGVRDVLRSPSISIFCTGHAKQYGLPEDRV